MPITARVVASAALQNLSAESEQRNKSLSYECGANHEDAGTAVVVAFVDICYLDRNYLNV